MIIQKVQPPLTRIYQLSLFFYKNIADVSMNSIIEAAKFEPEPISEKTYNEIKANNLKIITTIDMNVSNITSNQPSLSSEHLKPDLMPWILLQ